MAELNARRYFLEVLLPAYREFRESYTAREIGLRVDTRKAGALAQALIGMPEYVYLERKEELPFRSAREYRETLWKSSPSYELVCDVGNAIKHGKVSRTGRLVNGPGCIEERVALIEVLDVTGSYFISRKILLVKTQIGRVAELGSAFNSSLRLWISELRERKVSPEAIEGPTLRLEIYDKADPRGQGEFLVHMLEGEPDGINLTFLTYDVTNGILKLGWRPQGPDFSVDIPFRAVVRTAAGEI